MLAIELNDASVTVAKADSIHLQTPAYALLDSNGIVIGDEAQRSAFLKPAQTYNRFWDRLSTDLIPTANDHAQSYADLVQAHLHYIREQFGEDDIIYTAPATFNKTQLGLLLGISKKLSMPVQGVVDSALVAVEPVEIGSIIFIDISLHKVTLTVVKQTDRLYRAAYDYLADVGLVSIEKLWMKMISELFIQTSRYDPRHDASGEQQLYDLLPEWIIRLHLESDVSMEIDNGSHRYTATLQRDYVLKHFADIFDHTVQRASRLIDKEAIETIQCSHRIASLPGLIEALKDAFRQCEISVLEPGSAALGALKHQNYLCAESGDGIVFTSSLPSNELKHATAIGATNPTHLVYRGIAYPITKPLLPISIDSRSNQLKFTTTFSDQLPLASIYYEAGKIILDPLSKRVMLNHVEASEKVPLAIGDTLQIRSVDDEIQLIAIASSAVANIA